MSDTGGKKNENSLLQETWQDYLHWNLIQGYVVQDRLIKDQMGVVKYVEIVDNPVSITFIKFDDPAAHRKLIGTNSFTRQNN